MITNLSTKEFAQKIDGDQVVILDVRTQEEFSVSHIKNAVNIDFYCDDFKEKIEKLDKETMYFVYCRSGARSLRAANIMDEKKFKKIFHLENGLIDWVNNNLPL